MVSLYERRRDGRCLSMMVISEWGRGSPILPNSPPLIIPGNRNEGARVCNHLNDTINTTVTSTTSYNSSFYELEITELSRSPTDTRHSVWSFTPTHSPVLGRKSPPGPPTQSPVLGRKRSQSPPTYSPVLRRKSSPGHSASPSSLYTPDQGMLTSTPSITRNNIRESSEMVLEGLLGEGFHNMHTSDDRRQMVIGELIDTEQRYITNLEILLNIYLPALEHVVAPRDLRLLFPAQLEPLLERHRELLGRVEEREREQSPFSGTVGDIFNQLCNGGNSEFVNTYSAYMNEFRVAMQTLAKYEQSSLEFRELVLKCQHSSGCKGLSLSAYLLTPIQRLPRYELLLKELLKHTPLNHPDNYYLGEAVENLREELFRLNHSIKSCQLACSVTRIRNGRKPSFRRFSRSVRKTTRSLSQMKRHVSAANILDYSSDSGHNSSQGAPLSHLLHHGSISSIYRSEVNLMEDEDGEEGEAISTGERLRKSNRAASCSDLLFEMEPRRTRRTRLKFHHMEPLPSVPSLPSLPPTPQPSPQPSSLSGSSVVPMSSEESGPRPRSRVSVYSTASSTSGIASLGQSQLDLASMLTPTDSNTDSMHATPTPSEDVRVKTNTPARKHSLWNGALRLFKRKSSSFSRCNSSPSIKVDISAPMDFRHIQHVPHFMATPGSRTSAYL